MVGEELVSGVSLGVVCCKELAVLQEAPLEIGGVAGRDEACSPWARPGLSPARVAPVGVNHVDWSLQNPDHVNDLF